MRDRFIRILLAFVSFSACAAFIFYFYRSDLNIWDMPGAFNAAKYACENHWPWFSGWNQQAFGGYAQGYFYPPLLGWLSCGVGKVIGLEAAFRLLIAISVFLIPLASFTFLRSIGFSKTPSWMGSTCLLFFLIAAPDPISALGGTFSGTFFGGLVSAQFALPLFFFYLAALCRGVRNFDNLKSASLLLTLLALSHGFIALAAYFCSAITFFTLYLKKGTPWIRAYALHVLRFLLMSAVWWVPFLVYHGLYASGTYVNAAAFDESLYPWGAALFLALASFAGWKAYRSRSRSVRMLLLLGISTVVLYLFLREFPQLGESLTGGAPIQTNRFALFVLAFGSLLSGTIFGLHRHRIWIGVILSAALIYFTHHELDHQFAIRTRTITLPEVDPTARGLIWTNYRTEMKELRGELVTSISPHLLSMSLANQGYAVANGLYIESSNVSPYWAATLLELSPLTPDLVYPFVWHADTRSFNRSSLADHIRYLGVQWILTEKEFTRDQVKQLPIRSQKHFSLTFTKNQTSVSIPEHLYELKHMTAELLEVSPHTVSPRENWREISDQWWKNLVTAGSVPIRTHHPISEFDPPLSSDRVFAKYVSAHRIEVDVQASRSRWIYLKVPFFPNWHAYRGETEIPLYLAGGNMMVFNAHGKIDLRFERTWWEILLYGVSVTFVFAVLFTFAMAAKSKLRSTGFFKEH